MPNPRFFRPYQTGGAKKTGNIPKGGSGSGLSPRSRKCFGTASAPRPTPARFYRLPLSAPILRRAACGWVFGLPRSQSLVLRGRAKNLRCRARRRYALRYQKRCENPTSTRRIVRIAGKSRENARRQKWQRRAGPGGRGKWVLAQQGLLEHKIPGFLTSSLRIIPFRGPGTSPSGIVGLASSGFRSTSWRSPGSLGGSHPVACFATGKRLILFVA